MLLWLKSNSRIDMEAIHLKNEWIDTDAFDCEVVGFFEEIMDSKKGKMLGVILHTTLDRPLGARGRKDFELTAPTEMRRGHKMVIVKASPQRPVKVWGMMQPLCGKSKVRPTPARMAPAS